MPEGEADARELHEGFEVGGPTLARRVPPEPEDARVEEDGKAEVLDALDRADEVHARPSIIIARTTKGKGVSYMEYDNRWHGQPPNREQYERALAELEEGVRAWPS